MKRSRISFGTARARSSEPAGTFGSVGEGDGFDGFGAALLGAARLVVASVSPLTRSMLLRTASSSRSVAPGFRARRAVAFGSWLVSLGVIPRAFGRRQAKP